LWKLSKHSESVVAMLLKTVVMVTNLSKRFLVTGFPHTVLIRSNNLTLCFELFIPEASNSAMAQNSLCIIICGQFPTKEYNMPFKICKLYLKKHQFFVM
jgi:hypothetical protein